MSSDNSREWENLVETANISMKIASLINKIDCVLFHFCVVCILYLKKIKGNICEFYLICKLRYRFLSLSICDLFFYDTRTPVTCNALAINPINPSDNNNNIERLVKVIFCWVGLVWFWFRVMLCCSFTNIVAGRSGWPVCGIINSFSSQNMQMYIFLHTHTQHNRVSPRYLVIDIHANY